MAKQPRLGSGDLAFKKMGAWGREGEENPLGRWCMKRWEGGAWASMCCDGSCREKGLGHGPYPPEAFR